ncbi:putative Tubulin polyglutamylase TTLL4 [Blattamonas nauphoetae]|uniref:Tubulin--tyrosine ligase-like protein 5 n=1 Tax=Blattamonas nauphoetae TaxID=2049346 RepID=A0ABQ9XI51_9EUKA|nr:putative Tubulin polyglutamylase TTLL4 [Blattamonas nauphoetae]
MSFIPMKSERNPDLETKHHPLTSITLFPPLFSIEPAYILFGKAPHLPSINYGDVNFIPRLRLSSPSSILLRKTFQRSGFAIQRTHEDESWTVLWGSTKELTQIRHIQPYQKIVHFPATYELGRKDRLALHLRKSAGRVGQCHFEIGPLTFILPRDSDTLNQYLGHVLPQPSPETLRYTSSIRYIHKPLASARGIGVRMMDVNEMIGLRNSESASFEISKRCILQEYIASPLLVAGYKVDLRLYVCITSVNPLRVYLFKDGLVRFASNPFKTNTPQTESPDPLCPSPVDMDGEDKQYSHLTNYSVNKTRKDLWSLVGNEWMMPAKPILFDLKSNSVVEDLPKGLRKYMKPAHRLKLEQMESNPATASSVQPPNLSDCILIGDLDGDGTKWSFMQLLLYIYFVLHCNPLTVIHRIQDVLTKAIISSIPTFHKVSSFLPFDSPCSGFELFGVDVLLDSNLRPYILEFNTSPSLQSTSALDMRLKQAMLVDLLNMVGIPSMGIPGRKEAETRKQVFLPEEEQRDEIVAAPLSISMKTLPLHTDEPDFLERTVPLHYVPPRPVTMKEWASKRRMVGLSISTQPDLQTVNSFYLPSSQVSPDFCFPHLASSSSHSEVIHLPIPQTIQQNKTGSAPSVFATLAAPAVMNQDCIDAIGWNEPMESPRPLEPTDHSISPIPFVAFNSHVSSQPGFQLMNVQEFVRSFNQAMTPLAHRSSGTDQLTVTPPFSISQADALILLHAESEYARRGRFTRIFPTPFNCGLYGGVENGDSWINYLQTEPTRHGEPHLTPSAQIVPPPAAPIFETPSRYDRLLWSWLRYRLISSCLDFGFNQPPTPSILPPQLTCNICHSVHTNDPLFTLANNVHMPTSPLTSPVFVPLNRQAPNSNSNDAILHNIPPQPHPDHPSHCFSKSDQRTRETIVSLLQPNLQSLFGVNQPYSSLPTHFLEHLQVFASNPTTPLPPQTPTPSDQSGCDIDAFFAESPKDNSHFLFNSFVKLPSLVQFPQFSFGSSTTSLFDFPSVSLLGDYDCIPSDLPTFTAYLSSLFINTPPTHQPIKQESLNIFPSTRTESVNDISDVGVLVLPDYTASFHRSSIGLMSSSLPDVHLKTEYELHCEKDEADRRRVVLEIACANEVESEEDTVTRIDRYHTNAEKKRERKRQQADNERMRNRQALRRKLFQFDEKDDPADDDEDPPDPFAKWTTDPSFQTL